MYDHFFWAVVDVDPVEHHRQQVQADHVQTIASRTQDNDTPLIRNIWMAPLFAASQMELDHGQDMVAIQTVQQTKIFKE